MPHNKSTLGREELKTIVQHSLNLPTKREAEHIIGAVVAALEQTFLNNLDANGFSLKLGSFGKFTIRHKRSIRRKIPFTGETKVISAKRKLKFVSLGMLRRREVSEETSSNARSTGHSASTMQVKK